MKKRAYSFIAAGLLSAFGVANASADSVTYSNVSTSFTQSTQSTLVADLPEFNPNLGTLTSATIQVSVNLTPIISIFNITGSSLPFTEAFTGDNGTNPLGTPSPADPVTWSDPYGGVGSGTFAFLDTAGGTAAPGLTNIDGPSVSGSLNTAVPGLSLGNYVGTQTYALQYDVNSPAQTDGGSPSNDQLFYGGNFSLGGSIASITYDFVPNLGSAPTPLPKAMYAGLVLFAGLGCFKGFRKLSLR